MKAMLIGGEAHGQNVQAEYDAQTIFVSDGSGSITDGLKRIAYHRQIFGVRRSLREEPKEFAFFVRDGLTESEANALVAKEIKLIFTVQS